MRRSAEPANGDRMSLDADVDTTATGQIPIDLLPDGERSLNPYTGKRSEPLRLGSRRR